MKKLYSFIKEFKLNIVSIYLFFKLLMEPDINIIFQFILH